MVIIFSSLFGYKTARCWNIKEQIVVGVYEEFCIVCITHVMDVATCWTIAIELKFAQILGRRVALQHTTHIPSLFPML